MERRIVPYPHQLEIADEAYKILDKHKLVYLAMEERTGKTISAILTAEKTKVEKILIITKKKPLDDWKDTLSRLDLTKDYTVINYHSAHKIAGTFDLIILDEAHNYISSFPKRSNIWRAVKSKINSNTLIIYLSATPHAQGYQLLFNQLALSPFSPFSYYKTPYMWYTDFALRVNGNTDRIFLHGRYVETYKKVDGEKVREYIKHLFITKTRKELNFEQEPEDKLHYVTLGEATRNAYNTLVTTKYLNFVTKNNKEYYLVADTTMKLRLALHMLEGGGLKIDDEYITIGECSKINYILDKFKDSEDLAIMYNYKAEGMKLREVFNKALILQGTTFAEGVDLHHIKNLVIYSQDFSTARHSQRRARQANKNRKEPIIVHYILVKGGLSEQVYNSVSINKTNFVDSVFKREII